jgi:hypothetical protein
MRTASNIPSLAPWGGEGRGEVGDAQWLPVPTSSQARGVRPSLSPLQGGEESSRAPRSNDKGLLV